MKSKNGNDIPLGLGMALMQNPNAYFAFAELDEKQQSEVISGTKSINSRDEMRMYVDSISTMF